jgi:hypothetical protein
VTSISSKYTCTFPTITAGTYLAQANFAGDLNYKLSNSATINVVVAQVTPTLSVTGVQSNGTSGQVITYTATITGITGSLPPSGVPTWNLTGASNSCSSSTGPITNGVSSLYSCVVPASSAGSYSGGITYLGDSNYTSVGPSNPYLLNVSKFSPTISVTTSSPTTTIGSTPQLQVPLRAQLQREPRPGQSPVFLGFHVVA